MSANAAVDIDSVTNVFSRESSTYTENSPFPHIVLDDVFDPLVLKAIESEFPSAEHMAGSFKGEVEGGKFTESDWSKFGPVTQAFVAACNSGPFCRALSQLCGIPDLVSDPYLAGGGQHQTGRGGRLKVHSDFNVHPFLHLTRRLNMIVYLNEGWDPSWGGALELWDTKMTGAVARVEPTLGKVVVFDTTDTSFHGLPDGLTCPEGTYRRSLAFYYFTADGETPEPRSTLWKERPGESFLSRPTARMRRSAGLAKQSLTTLIGR